MTRYEAFQHALAGVPMTREDIASHIGVTARALRYYATGERRLPRLVALEVLKLSEPDRCVCAAIKNRHRSERCNYCRKRRLK